MLVAPGHLNPVLGFTAILAITDLALAARLATWRAGQSEAVPLEPADPAKEITRP